MIVKHQLTPDGVQNSSNSQSISRILGRSSAEIAELHWILVKFVGSHKIQCNFLKFTKFPWISDVSVDNIPRILKMDCELLLFCTPGGVSWYFAMIHIHHAFSMKLHKVHRFLLNSCVFNVKCGNSRPVCKNSRNSQSISRALQVISRYHI